MQFLAVTEAITTIAEAERRLGLSRSNSPDFFPEWRNQLPEINSSDRLSLKILGQRYVYHRSGGHLLESTMILLLVSPLLAIAGLYDPLEQWISLRRREIHWFLSPTDQRRAVVI
jgi:hypothetical protein